MDGVAGRIVCRAVLFDLDGVLVDSTDAFHRHWLRWAAGQGLDGEATFQVGHGLRTADHIRLVAPHLDADLEARRFEETEVDDVGGIRGYEGGSALLASLPPGGWAVVTSSIGALARARLRAAGLPLPAVLVSGLDVRRGKPDPEGYLRASELLGVRPADAVVIEDSPAGVAAGRAAGALVVGVPTTHRPEQLAGADLVAPLSAISVLESGHEAITLRLAV